MRYFVPITLLCFLMAFSSCAADTPAALASPVSSPSETIHVGTDDVKIHYGSHIVYVIAKNPDRASERAGMPELDYLVKFRLPVEFKGRLAVNDDLVKIAGETKKVVFASSDSKIMTVENGEALKDNEGFEDRFGAGVIKFWSDGDVILTATCGDATAKIPFHVVRIPVDDECGKDKLITVLGLPDKQVKKFIEWPDDKIVDGLFYRTRDGEGLSVEHWMYDKYPGAIFEMSGSSLVPFVKQSEWADLSTDYFVLDHPDQDSN